MPESNSSSQGFNLKRWTVSANETASHFSHQHCPSLQVDFLAAGAGLQQVVELAMRQALSFLGLPIYFKFKIFFYAFTKALGQRFDIFSSPSPRFIMSINHCCSSNRVLASVILSESALPSIIYFL